MVIAFDRSTKPNAVVWSLAFESFNQTAFNSTFLINGVEKVNHVIDVPLEKFGRDIAILFDRSANRWSISRQRLESDLVYFFAAEGRLLVSNNFAQIRSLAHAHELNEKWMLNFFSFTDGFTDESPIKGVSILPTQSQIDITHQGYEIKRQLISAKQGVQGWSTKQWINQWRSSSQQAVADCCKHESSVAIMLSSGVDSGGIAAYLVDQRRKNNEPLGIKGFSWRFPNHEQADESVSIQSLVDHLNLDHEFIDIDDAECFSEVSTWPVSLDAPYFNAMRRIKKKLYATVASQDFDVILNGHMGDELCFVDRYMLSELWRDNKLAWLKELSHVCLQKGLDIRNDAGFRYWLKHLLNQKNKALAAPLSFTETAKTAYQNYGLGGRAEVSSSSNSRPEQLGLLTANSELAAIVTERAFTAEYAIHRYHPYLNPELISLALACPAYLLSTQKQTKWISRRALLGLLPSSLLNRSREGQLDELFEQGLEKNVDAIKAYLWRSERRWHEFIREDVVLEILQQKRWDQAASTIVPCLGFERWLDEWRSLDMPVL